MATDLIPISDIARMADAVAKSGLFGVKSPDQALALMLVAQAEGRHPAIAARDYHIIQGRPTLKADAILARFQEAGGRIEWHAYTAEQCEATFAHPQGGSLRIAWTMEDARRAGLGGRDTWKQYPRAMLRSRLISEGVRTVYPAVLCGIYTPDEAADLPPPRPMGAAEIVLPSIPTTSRADAIVDRLAPPVAESPKPDGNPETAATSTTIRSAVDAAIARVGREKVVAMLASFGWRTPRDIQPDQIAEAIEVLDGLAPETKGEDDEGPPF
jgi:hypothetical protein